MKTLLTLLFLLLNVFALTAQDLIVNSAGDSLNVKITRVKAGYIYYNYKAGRQVRSALFPPDSVTFYQLDFYPYAAVPSGKVITRGEISNWRIALNGGWSWLAAPADPSLNSFEQKYLNDLRSGHQFGADLNYFFTSKIGIGLIYNAFLTSNAVYASAQFQNNVIKNGELSDDIFVNFIGPSFNFRLLSRKNTNAIWMDATIGYTDYRDNSNFIGDTIILTKITGNTIGINFDFGYDFGVSKHFAVGAGISLKVAALDSYELTENGYTHKVILDQNSYQSFARADIFLGIRFR